jgi:hypothetical protein
VIVFTFWVLTFEMLDEPETVQTRFGLRWLVWSTVIIEVKIFYKTCLDVTIS